MKLAPPGNILWNRNPARTLSSYVSYYYRFVYSVSRTSPPSGSLQHGRGRWWIGAGSGPGVCSCLAKEVRMPVQDTRGHASRPSHRARGTCNVWYTKRTTLRLLFCMLSSALKRHWCTTLQASHCLKMVVLCENKVL